MGHPTQFIWLGHSSFARKLSSRLIRISRVVFDRRRLPFRRLFYLHEAARLLHLKHCARLQIVAVGVFSGHGDGVRARGQSERVRVRAVLIL
jgi:hypothetical protein